MPALPRRHFEADLGCFKAVPLLLDRHRWDESNAEAMMALAGLYHSGLWHTYWKSERAAA